MRDSRQLRNRYGPTGMVDRLAPNTYGDDCSVSVGPHIAPRQALCASGPIAITRKPHPALTGVTGQPVDNTAEPPVCTSKCCNGKDVSGVGSGPHACIACQTRRGFPMNSRGKILGSLNPMSFISEKDIFDSSLQHCALHWRVRFLFTDMQASSHIPPQEYCMQANQPAQQRRQTTPSLGHA